MGHGKIILSGAVAVALGMLIYSKFLSKYAA
jgi:hypothetical protein